VLYHTCISKRGAADNYHGIFQMYVDKNNDKQKQNDISNRHSNQFVSCVSQCFFDAHVVAVTVV
jgi:hypothetical protein